MTSPALARTKFSEWGRKPPAVESLGLEELRLRLAEAEETLRAIQSGDVDAVVVSGPEGQQIYTLRGAEYAYRALVEAMNEGAATVASDGTILYCNQRVPSILQVASEKLIGSRVNSFIAKPDRQTFSALFARALAGEGGKAEIQFLVSDGSLTPAYVSLSRLAVDATPAVCMVITDLREYKQREELIAEGDLARSILEHTREAIAVCDDDGRVLLANEALRNLCGRNPLFEDLDDVLPLELPLDSGKQTKRFSVLSDMLQGKTIRAEQVIFRRDGQVFWLLLSAGPLLSGDQVMGSVLTLVDVTKRKLAEKALLRSEKLAATGQLAATIAHEINNPLSAIFNLLYLIENETSLEKVRDLAAGATNELARVSHITKQTLAFYRDSARPDEIRLSDLLDEIVALFKKEFEVKKIICEREYTIPGAMCGYPGELRQVFSNLIRNAIDAVPERGHIRLGIRRARRAGKDGVAVFVCDNGSGIEAGTRSRIFEPFFTTKGGKGTGLGLWVASDLVQKHGGMIRVRSSHIAGRTGSCFYVFLPVAAQ
jgi:PAS domain S-box-containing protein